MASFTKELKPQLANGRLPNRGLTSLAKESTVRFSKAKCKVTVKSILPEYDYKKKKTTNLRVHIMSRMPYRK